MTLIMKAQEEDLEKILELQYLAYQSEAKLFSNMDIPPLKQTIEEAYDEFQRGIILKAEDDAGNIIGSVRAYQEDGTVYIFAKMLRDKSAFERIEMLLRDYKPSDYNCLAELFYQTVHCINAKDYTEEQLNAWATGKVDIQEWDSSFPQFVMEK